ncbi:hypothetical protein P2R26_25450 [Escherichia coli]
MNKTKGCLIANFATVPFLLLSGATNSAQMYHEAAALSSELDTRWSYRSKELMTLYSKAKSYEAGERVEFGGKSFAPLYTPKKALLQIVGGDKLIIPFC